MKYSLLGTYSIQSIFKIITISMLLFFLPSTLLAEMLSVNGDKVNLRTGPGKGYKAKWEYGKGLPLMVIQRKGNWINVEDFEGDSGWIYKKLLYKKPQMVVKANRNKDKKINIRKNPDLRAKIIGKAYYGVVFKTIEQKSGWVNVKHESGLEGWIKRSLLWGY